MDLQRWRKRLHDFAANLFRKLYSKFHQNRESFIEDITKNILVSFLDRHTVVVQQLMRLPYDSATAVLFSASDVQPANPNIKRTYGALMTCLSAKI